MKVQYETGAKTIIKKEVEKKGWTSILIQGGGRKSTPGVVHTVGLTATYGSPEILVAGMDLKAGERVLDALVADIRAEGAPSVGEKLTGYLPASAGDLVLLDMADDQARIWMPVADWYNGGQFSGLQAIWPDTRGRYPWDEGFDPGPDSSQPLLTPRAH
ncbi:DUF4262 domain-containing protein [Rhodovibrio sodomensis]|nr:DUF4262 domain-containing protein [Rhodovibrio sodomensis]